MIDAYLSGPTDLAIVFELSVALDSNNRFSLELKALNLIIYQVKIQLS